MFMNHGFDMVTIVINIKMKIFLSVALISPLPTLLGRPGETRREANTEFTDHARPRVAGCFRHGLSTSSFYCHGKGQARTQQLACGGGRAPRGARSPVSVNSGRSPEITSMERPGGVTFDLEANIGFCFFDLPNSFGVPDLGGCWACGLMGELFLTVWASHSREFGMGGRQGLRNEAQWSGL